ncbi:MAG: DUF3192 domain-containing protein [Lentisphaeria bacterium]
MKNFFLMIFFLLICCSCISPIEQDINLYLVAAKNVKLGQSKDYVLQNFSSLNQSLAILDQKQPEKFTKNGKLVEIYYFRSGWQDDGITTDDEFTPYIFENDILTAIGWTTLGGPKTQGKARPRIDYDRHWNTHFYYYR